MPAEKTDCPCPFLLDLYNNAIAGLEKGNYILAMELLYHLRICEICIRAEREDGYYRGLVLREA